MATITTAEQFEAVFGHQTREEYISVLEADIKRFTAEGNQKAVATYTLELEKALIAEVTELQAQVQTLASALNISHNLTALGWNINDTLSLATKFIELRQTQVEELAEAVKKLDKMATRLGLLWV